MKYVMYKINGKWKFACHGGQPIPCDSENIAIVQAYQLMVGVRLGAGEGMFALLVEEVGEAEVDSIEATCAVSITELGVFTK